MTTYKIRSRVMRERGERYESIDKVRAEKRLRQVKASFDPNARLIAVPASR